MRSLIILFAIVSLLVTNTLSLTAGVTGVHGRVTDTVLNPGDSLIIDVEFDEVISVDAAGGVPYLELMIGVGTARADYFTGSGSTTLSFYFVVKNGHHTSELNYSGTDALNPNGADIQSAGGPVTPTLPGTQTSDSLGGSNIEIADNVAPRVVSRYVVGDLANEEGRPGNGCNLSSSEGYTYVADLVLEFDEGVFDQSGNPLTGINFVFSDVSSAIRCDITDKNGDSLTGGETEIRLRYILDGFASGSAFSVILNGVHDATLANAATGPVTEFDFEVNRVWSYEIQGLDARPGVGGDQPLRFGTNVDRPYEESDADHDHVCTSGAITLSCPVEFALRILDDFQGVQINESFGTRYDENYRYEQFIGISDFIFPVVINHVSDGTPSGGSIDATLSWSQATANSPNSDYYLALRPTGDGNPQSETIDMRSVTTLGSLTFPPETTFEIVYGPPQLVDTEAPSITGCPSLHTIVLAEDQCAVILSDLTGSVTGADEFDASLTVSQNLPVGMELTAGNHVLLFSVADDAGNSAQCSTTVEVVDDQAPEISNCPGTVVKESEAFPVTASWTEPGVTDNCGATISGSHAPDASLFDAGRTVVTYTASDDAANSTTCSFAVLVFTDTDMDDLDDAWELEHFNTLALTGADDPDRDTITNADEFLNGTNPNSPILDVDANGDVDALTDGILLLRYMLGFRGEALIKDAIGENAIRSSAAAVEAFLE